MAGPAQPGRHRARLVAALGASLIGLLYLLAAATAPLLPDEMYYWDWSRHPAAGYFDHPRLIAVAIHGGTVLAGTTPFGVRLVPLICGLLTLAALYRSARLLGGIDAGRRLCLIVAGMPLITASFLLATPDAPFLAATGLTIYCTLRALREEAARGEALLAWMAAGAMAGLALQAKYTAFLVLAGFGVAFLASSSLRPLLRSAGPWAGAVMALLIAVPMLWWNAGHDWVSLQFQLHHGLGASAGGNTLVRELTFVGGQFAIVNPMLLLLLGAAVWNGLASAAVREQKLLGIVAVVVFGCFVISASRRPVEANWPAPAYLPAIILLAVIPLSPVATRWLWIGAGVGMGLTVIALVHVITPVLPLAREVDQLADSYGWPAVSGAVNGLVERERASGRRAFVAGNRYQETAALAYHLAARPAVFSLNVDYRPNQYDLWPRFEQVARPGDDLVLVIEPGAKADSVLDRLGPSFDSARMVTEVERRRGERVLSPRDLWLLTGWKGAALPNGFRP
jgi:4-amino-4-deoxy-L-arabinose transferase-like glycosyltransferase